MTIKEFNGVNSESFDDNGDRKTDKADSDEESSSSNFG